MKMLNVLGIGVMTAGLLSGLGCASTSTCCGSCEGEEVVPDVELPTTKDQQSNATPQQVLDKLMAGNARYAKGQRTPIDIQQSLKVKADGQYPLAYVLSCVDSRVPVEVVFDQGIGDVFVGRVAGNIENTDQLGSMEFATAAAGSKLILVLGHAECGAVKGSISDVKLGNLTSLLNEIKPAINESSQGYAGDKTADNGEFVNKVIEANVRKTLKDIRERSEVLTGLEEEGKIMIVGGIYSLETGKVTLLD